jgi:hypothetical protein
MGKGFFRLVEAAITSGALIIPSYAAAGDAAPRTAEAPGASALVVQSARLDASGLVIEFSKPLRASEAIDPSRFRLTFAYYGRTRPGYYSYDAAQRRPTTRYENVGSAALATTVKSAGPSAIRIPAASGFRLAELCKQIASSTPSIQKDAGLYLHYVADGARDVQSADGAVLGSIAPYWVGAERAAIRPGAFAGKPIPVAVRCR